MSLLNKISFQVTKAFRMYKYKSKYRRQPWAEIESVKIPVSLNYGYSVLRFIDNGEYEYCEISIIKKTVEPDDRVMELGTGIGFVSAYCAKKIGSDRIHTYEANPTLQALIQKTYMLNDVQPAAVQAMLGSEVGTHDFHVEQTNFLASSALPANQSGQQTITVPILSLNEEIAKIKPSYLIMDIEGGEYDIFKAIDFQTIKKIQFELHPAILPTGAITFIFQKLKNSGFKKSILFNFENNFFYER